jgi:hypothetical protein
MPDISSLMGSFGGFPIGLTVIPVVIIAIVLLSIARRGSAQANASKHWESTTGQVLLSQIQMRRASARTGMTPYPVVVYEYQVMGQRYQSSRISFGTDMGGSLVAQPTLDKYPAGSTVTVYYNPTNPAEAVLERRSRSSGILVWVVVIMIALVLCSMVISLGAMGFAGQWVSDIMGQLPSR